MQLREAQREHKTSHLLKNDDFGSMLVWGREASFSLSVFNQQMCPQVEQLHDDQLSVTGW